MSQHTLDLRMLQELISSPPCHEVNSCKYDLGHHRCITVLSVQTDQCHLCHESEMRQIGGNGLESRGEFASIVAIASAGIGTHPLARMHLQRGGACADHLTSLASFVPRRTDGIEPSFRGRQCRIAGQGSLSCGLACGIHIEDDGATSLPIPKSTNALHGPSCHKAVLLEEGTKGLQARTIHIRQETAEAGAMGKAFAPEQCHECCSERFYALKEVRERPLSTDGIAQQQDKEINGFIAAKASTHQTNVLPKGFKKFMCCKTPCEDGNFGKPWRNRGTANRRGLNLYTLVRYHI